MSAYRSKNHDFNARLQSLHDELQRKNATHSERGRVVVSYFPELIFEFADRRVVGVTPHSYGIDRRFKNERENMLKRMDLEQ